MQNPEEIESRKRDLIALMTGLIKIAQPHDADRLRGFVAGISGRSPMSKNFLNKNANAAMRGGWFNIGHAAGLARLISFTVQIEKIYNEELQGH